LDLSRGKVDVCLISEEGELVDEWASPPDADGLRGLAARAAMQGPGVRGVIESMNGARFVRDQLEERGWDVLIADAQKVKGLAPLACKTDKIDARVLAQLSCRDLVPAIWLPDPGVRGEREPARFRLHLVRHRTSLENRITPRRSPSVIRARSPTSSGTPAASCWTAWRSRIRGGATSTSAWRSSTTSSCRSLG
jgi:transposase